MHPILALYCRAYLTAVHLELPPDQKPWPETDFERQPPPPGPGLLARAASWLRKEWNALREAQEKDSGERIYWPPDL